MLGKFIEKIVRWYNGEDKVREGFTTDRIVMMPSFYTEYHWTAKVARGLVGFVRTEWKWVVSTIVAILAIVVAL